jgi:hypothetical protein
MINLTYAISTVHTILCCQIYKKGSYFYHLVFATYFISVNIYHDMV